MRKTLLVVGFAGPAFAARIDHLRRVHALATVVRAHKARRVLWFELLSCQAESRGSLEAGGLDA